MEDQQPLNINNHYLLTFGGSKALLMNSDGSIYKTIDLANYFGLYFNPSYMTPKSAVFDPSSHKFIISYFTGHWEDCASIEEFYGIIDDPWFYLFTGIYTSGADYSLVNTNAGILNIHKLS